MPIYLMTRKKKVIDPTFFADLPLPFPKTTKRYTIEDALEAFAAKYNKILYTLEIEEVQRKIESKVFKQEKPDQNTFLFLKKENIDNAWSNLLSGMTFEPDLKDNEIHENMSKEKNSLANASIENQSLNNKISLNKQSSIEKAFLKSPQAQGKKESVILNKIDSESLKTRSNYKMKDENEQDLNKKEAKEPENENFEDEQIVIKRRTKKPKKKQKKLKYESDEVNIFETNNEEEMYEYLKFKFADNEVESLDSESEEKMCKKAKKLKLSNNGKLK